MCNKIFIFLVAVASLASCQSSQKPAVKKPPVALAAKQEVHFPMTEDITTLDPRQGRLLGTLNIISLLFEGLTRTDEQGNATPALAEKIEISEDMRTYTFHLREAKWSNGKPVTARDFEYAWRSSLKRELHAPYAYQFFAIKNAQAVYNEQIPATELGIEVPDARTLVVRLEKPMPYFLELLASPPFYPVEQSWAEAQQRHTCVSNGPFALAEWLPQVSITLKKNAEYHASSEVTLQTVTFSVLDDYTALNLFHSGELDWAGSSMGVIPTDAIASLKEQQLLRTVPATGTQFLRVNTSTPLLNNPKVRRALALAIDRQAIVDHVMQANQIPATALVPPCMGLPTTQFFPVYDVQAAAALLAEAKQEMNLQGELPAISLSYVASDRAQKIAQVIQQNLQQALGVSIILEPTEAKMLFQKVTSGNYQLAMGSWFADFFDPISFLSVFQYRDNGTNNTSWESAEYAQLLERSSSAATKEARYMLLDKAQSILLSELPIIPIFYYTFSYVQNPRLKDARLEALGRLDLQHAYCLNEQL